MSGELPALLPVSHMIHVPMSLCACVAFAHVPLCLCRDVPICPCEHPISYRIILLAMGPCASLAVSQSTRVRESPSYLLESPRACPTCVRWMTSSG